ncbi:MAG: hypothetical protein ACRCW2_09350 [Cellulosilyticaceae bacterium]
MLSHLIADRPNTLGFPGCWEIAPNTPNQEKLIRQIATTLQHCLDDATYESVLFGWQATETALSTLLSNLNLANYEVNRLKLADPTAQ